MIENFEADNKEDEKKSTDNRNNNETEKQHLKTLEQIDILLRKKDAKIVDIESLITETQKRIWGALTKGYQYEPIADDSDILLRKFVSSRVHMIVMYVDLVGSTNITLSLPEDKVATIISSFAQEMALVITQHEGYVLKFVGDAVIGFFIAEATKSLAANNAINCARSMLKIIDKGINPILNQYDYPELAAKIGMDYGENIIVRYGADEKKSHVDILGPAMNIAAKIQNMAKPNQILIGEDVYTKLNPQLKKSFQQVVWSKHQWKYQDRETGKLYPVLAYVG